MKTKITKLFIIITLTLLLNFTFSPSIQAETLQEKAKRVKTQIASLGDDLSGISKQYSENDGKLDVIREDIVINKVKLKRASADLSNNQQTLNKRAGSLYRYDKTTILEVILSSKSFGDFLSSWDLINRIGKRDGEVVAKIKRLRIKIKRAQEKLIKAEKEQSEVVDQLEKQKDKIEAGLAKQKAMMSGIESEIEKLNRIPKAVPIPSGSSNPGKVSSRGWVFPVASPHSFSNDWGAPRSGGRRHKGNDIFTNMGSPAYAVVSGSVSNLSGGNAGLWQILRGDDGNQYWYMHQSGFAVSGRVSQGQVIGYAGNTGNARGGAVHVHFEYHPGGGAAVNPYPYLTAAQ